jgi:hypothetical protein
MLLPCLEPRISRPPHPAKKCEGGKWSRLIRSSHERVRSAVPRMKLGIRLFERKHQTYSQSLGAYNPTPRQQTSMRNTARHGSSPSSNSGSEYVIPPPTDPIQAEVLAMPRYIDRACQTDLRPTSSLSTYELVSEKTLDECLIPNAPPPPYTLRQGSRR